jgi:hypothetical protein
MIEFGEKVTNKWLDFSPEYAAKLMDDIRLVGSEKPLGYLPLETILGCGVRRSEAIAEADNAGNIARYFIGNGAPGLNGSIYVYNLAALQSLLDDHAELLADRGWPANADSFVERVVFDHSTEPGTPLFNLIADVFNDKTNPLRSDVD